MKPGSLVVPIDDYAKFAKAFGAFIVKPFYPNPSTICTAKEILEGGGLRVEECAAYRLDGSSCWAFDIAYWREVQAPEEVNIEEIMESSKTELV